MSHDESGVPDGRLKLPEEVTLPLSESAPHLAVEESHTEWRTATSAEIRADRAALPEDKWPGEWHVFAWAIASGSSQRDIARELKYTEAWVSTVCNKPEVVRKIEEIRNQHWGKNLDKRFANMAPKAADFMSAVIEGKGDGRDAKISERLSASQWALEKVTGKPKPAGENDAGTTVLNILQALDSLKRTSEIAQGASQERDVLELAEGTAPKESDWMDDFLAKQKVDAK